MADFADKSLMQAQFKKASNRVNALARRTGVNYQRWPQVSEVMEAGHVDAIEVASFMENSVVVEVSQMFGAMRYQLEPGVSDGRIEGAMVSVWEEVITIEIINLKIKEA